jgi:predicted DNA-binding protein with PD1-like motif
VNIIGGPLRRLITLALLLTFTAAPLARAAAPDTTYAAATASPARFWAIRLSPGADVRQELQRFARAKHLRAGFIASCAGSCARAAVRYANQPEASVREGHFEIVSLTGTLAEAGMHVHIELADSTGAGFGGHLMDGSRVYTTAEIVIGELERLEYAREVDATYGYRELAVKKR